MKNRCLIALLVVCVFCTTGCFRVSRETRALRDAVLQNAGVDADEKIELGVGMLTVGLAKLASKFVDIPEEARTALGSLKGAECSVYQFTRRTKSLAAILQESDRAMAAYGCERLVGVLQENQLVAVYIPAAMNSVRNLKASVLVVSDKQLVCATAHADAQDLLQLAMKRATLELPARTVAAKF